MGLLIDFFLFIAFLPLQSLFINGMYFCFEKGSIFYNLAPSFFDSNANKQWAKPLWKCIRCMASVHGTITFWAIVFPIWGINYFSVVAWLFDIGILVSLNFVLFKKI